MRRIDLITQKFYKQTQISSDSYSRKTTNGDGKSHWSWVISTLQQLMMPVRQSYWLLYALKDDMGEIKTIAHASIRFSDKKEQGRIWTSINSVTLDLQHFQPDVYDELAKFSRTTRH